MRSSAVCRQLSRSPERRSFSSGSVRGIVCPAGFHFVLATFLLNASQDRLCPVCSTSIAALASMLLAKDLRLGCFIFIRGRPSRDILRTVQRGTLPRVASVVTNLNQTGLATGYREEATEAAASFSRSCSFL